MTVKIFILSWLILIIICILEAYFTVPYDKDFDEYKLKRDKKDEHKGTS